MFCSVVCEVCIFPIFPYGAIGFGWKCLSDTRDQLLVHSGHRHANQPSCQTTGVGAEQLRGFPFISSFIHIHVLLELFKLINYVIPLCFSKSTNKSPVNVRKNTEFPVWFGQTRWWLSNFPKLSPWHNLFSTDQFPCARREKRL